MKNFDSIFAAYLIGLAVFFGFYVSVATRTASLRREVEQLKDVLLRGK